jgi:lycopene beta-cyclase
VGCGPEVDADVVIVGGGAAGLSLAHALTLPGARRELAVAVVETPRRALRPGDRTWCFWQAGPADHPEAEAASWARLRVRGRDGGIVDGELRSLRYRMLRSDAFEASVRSRLAGLPGVRLVAATAEAVHDTPGGAVALCTGDDGRRIAVRGRHLFDSRPLPALPPARTVLLQHFRGWFVRTARPAFDPDVVELMDFRVPQPVRGLAFGYVLPLGPAEALVEYTEFSRAPLSRDAYTAALEHYTRDVLRLGPFEVRAEESGVIPMTDARYPRRAGDRVHLIGAAGGATRPSTGYTFSAVQRQTRAVAAALRDGRAPRLPAPHRRRALAMDAVVLRALDTGRIDGPRFFTDLFRRVPAERVLRFLDGTTALWEDLLVGCATPVAPMLRTVAELPFLPRKDAPAAPAPRETRPDEPDDDPAAGR